MGNYCTSRCRRDQLENRDHRVVQECQQIMSNDVVFKQKNAITQINQIVFPLSAKGPRIVDAFDRRVKLAFVCWQGCQTTRFCVEGLEYQKIQDLCQQIKSLRFNGVRLIYSTQMVLKNPLVKQKYISKNPLLKGKRAMDILDVVVNSITRAGLMVILSNHCNSPCQTITTTDGQGLWWNDKYSEFQWLDSHKHVASRYKHNPRVIGLELRGHIRGTNKVDPTWGDNSMVSDWRRAAQICAHQVLSLNKHTLIFVGGLSYGCQLKQIKEFPLEEVDINKIVYTGSFFISHWSVLSWRLHNYETFRKEMNEHLMCIRSLNSPVFLNHFSYEFEIPWKYIIRELQAIDIDWSFSSFDLYKHKETKTSTPQPSKLLNPDIMNQLNKIQISACAPFVPSYMLPSQLITSNLVQVTDPHPYNIDELLDSTPGHSIAGDLQQDPCSRVTDRGQIYIEINEDGLIEPPPQVPAKVQQ